MCYVQINNYRLRNSTGDQYVLVQIRRSTIIYRLMINCGGNPSSCAQNFAQLCKLHLIDIGKQTAVFSHCRCQQGKKGPCPRCHSATLPLTLKYIFRNIEVTKPHCTLASCLIYTLCTITGHIESAMGFT